MLPPTPSGLLVVTTAALRTLRSRRSFLRPPCGVRPASPVPYAWAMSRRCRNRLQHALHGNGGPRGRTTWPKGQVAQVAERLMAPRQLMQPQKVSDLQAAGWELPAGVAPEEHVRVYDTRIEQHWLHQMVLEAFPGAPSNMKLVGGDFLTRPFLTDTEALNPCRLRRWGPEGIGPYHLVVPPRPHQGAWLERAVQQLPLEDPESAITVCCILDRAACPDAWTREALCQSLPCCAPVVKAPNVQVRAAAEGKCPPLLRVPANGKQLPPPKWGRCPAGPKPRAATVVHPASST